MMTQKHRFRCEILRKGSGFVREHGARGSIVEQIESNQRRFDELHKSFEELGLQRWKNPGPYYANRQEKVFVQMSEIMHEQDRLIRDFDALIESHDEEIKFIEEHIRSSWMRMYDLEKHITTLSTAASIVGVAALLQLFTPDADLKLLIIGSLVCFMVAIIAAVIAMFGDHLEIELVGLELPHDKLGDKVMGLALRVWLELAWVVRTTSMTAFCLALVIIIVFVTRSV